MYSDADDSDYRSGSSDSESETSSGLSEQYEVRHWSDVDDDGDEEDDHGISLVVPPPPVADANWELDVGRARTFCVHCC